MSSVDRVAVWGASGSGKSTFVRSHIARAPRVVVFDPLQEHGGTACASIAAVRDAMAHNWSRFRISYAPPSGSEVEALSRLSGLILAAQQPFRDGVQRAPLVFVVEEMNLGFPMGAAGRCPMFAELCSRGRHYGVELVGVSQRVAEVDTRFRGNASVTVAFRQQGPRDKAAAAAELGLSPADLPAENFHYVRAAQGQVTRHKLRKPRRR